MIKMMIATLLVVVLFLCAASAQTASPATFTTLVSFNGPNGSGPISGMIQGTDGNLYGTTSQGGTSTFCIYGCGTIFSLTPSGTLTTLYSFCSQPNCADGLSPNGLVQASNGYIYGSTSGYGGNYGGTIFRITPSGAFTTLYSFCSLPNCADGTGATGNMVIASNGYIYGVNVSGGNIVNGICPFGCGTVFRITPSGVLTTLHSFNGIDGAWPVGLTQAFNGLFYGVTKYGGGSTSCTAGCGTIFQMTASGALSTMNVFYGPNGSDPRSGLIQAANGNFYGTTFSGGDLDSGTIFSMTPNGQLTTMHSFGRPDSFEPSGLLTQGTDGNLYGTTQVGVTGQATIFNISPSGTFTTLYNFCSEANCPDGAIPFGQLVQATNGKFYGTAYEGGGNSTCPGGCGTIFSLATGLGPFVKTLSPSGKVGTTVKILGTNLTGATSVTFNGVPAAFTVGSRSFITTTVPAGATSGLVLVITPRGTLSSKFPFRVTQ